MTNGLNASWLRGDSTVTEHKGKNGGPSVKTQVTKVLTPKGFDQLDRPNR
jgi:hypothetical protein